jgi:hypothetical protein
MEYPVGTLVILKKATGVWFMKGKLGKVINSCSNKRYVELEMQPSILGNEGYKIKGFVYKADLRLPEPEELI